MSGDIKGIRGQIKKHVRPVARKGMAPTQHTRSGDGELELRRCRSCETEVLVPQQVTRVRCGLCTQLFLAKLEDML